MGMFVASILLCCFASVIESGRVNFPVPPMPESFPCLKGRKCPAPWPICPNPGPRCGIAKGRCCQPEVVTHRRCPKGSLTGRLCNRLKPCPYGYTCKRGRCCSNQCPKGVLQGSFCDRKRQCKRGYKCTKGVCCRRKIIIAANPCFLPKKPGRCKAYGPSWFYNPISRECEKFIYGGCGGNGNRFGTLKECQTTCTGFCPGGARPFKGMPPKCALSKRPFPAGCTSDKQCPKGKKCCPTYCGGRRCVTAQFIKPLGFCPGGARPFKGMPPKCALSKRPFPAGCTSDKQCPKGKKCCPTYCGGRRCVTALKFPPP